MRLMQLRMSIRLDLDWTVRNFFGFGSELYSTLLHKVRIRTGFGLN